MQPTLLPQTGNMKKPVTPRSWKSPPEPITAVLSLVSLACFAAMFSVNGNFGAFLLPVPERLLLWGANYMPFTFGLGEHYRLVTALFAHAGILHLLTNLYVLHDLGSALEATIGWRRYLMVVATCGAASSLSAVTQDPTYVSCGISGVIFGIAGCLFVMSGSPDGKDLMFARHRWLIVIFAAYMLALGFVTQGVDNAAHIGGLCAGIIFGRIFSKQGWRSKWSGVDSIIGLAAFALVCTIFQCEAFVLTGDAQLTRIAKCREAITVAKWEKNYPAAIRLMDHAIGAECSDPVLYVTRGGFLCDAKRYAEAVEDYSRALELKADDRSALAGRSVALHRLGQDGSAIEDLNVLIKLDPGKPLPYNNRAWSLIASGDPATALLDCEYALQLDPGLATAYDTKAVALFNLQRLDDALSCINRSISLTADGAAYYHRAEILLAMGRIDESAHDFKRAKTLQYEPEPWEIIKVHPCLLPSGMH